MTADPLLPGPADRFHRALASLRGLSVGDALGAQFAVPARHQALVGGEVPPGRWSWTDDTEMACSVLAVLAARGGIDQDALVRSFAEHHDAGRGYGSTVGRLLRLIREEGADWREQAAGLFNGQGSWGNGAAMRIAPLGAWYAGDPEQALRQAELSAGTTHQHPEAVAGAMAGNAVEGNTVAGQTYQVTLRLNDNSRVTLTQNNPNGLRPGDRARIENNMAVPY